MMKACVRSLNYVPDDKQDQLLSFPRLHTLTLLTHIDPNIVRRLTTLTSLNLACSRFKAEDSIASLTSLTHLDVAMYEYISDFTISKLTNLRSLDLTRNDLVTKVTMLTALTSLSLENNYVISSVQGLANLTTLDISRVSLVYVLGLPQSITTLILNNTNNTHRLRGLHLLTGLTKLDVSYTSLNTNDISTLTNLTWLDVRQSHDIRKCPDAPLVVLKVNTYCSYKLGNIQRLSCDSWPEMSDAYIHRVKMLPCPSAWWSISDVVHLTLMIKNTATAHSMKHITRFGSLRTVKLVNLSRGFEPDIEPYMEHLRKLPLDWFSYKNKGEITTWHGDTQIYV